MSNASSEIKECQLILKLLMGFHWEKRGKRTKALKQGSSCQKQKAKKIDQCSWLCQENSDNIKQGTLIPSQDQMIVCLVNLFCMNITCVTHFLGFPTILD